jgi:hypothetical protein
MRESQKLPADGSKDRPWTLDEALDFVRCLQLHLAQLFYGVGLTGSVVMKGESTNDLDVIIFPWTTTEQSYSSLMLAFREHGMRRRFSRPSVQRTWIQRGSHDKKHVEIWVHERRRVDIFFLT